jgi:hypothetical protein
MPFCPNCDTLKSFLTGMSAPFQERNLEDDDVNVDLIYDGVVPTEAPLMRVRNTYFEPNNLFHGGRLNTEFVQSTVTGVMNGIIGY